ncbi:hypothetical protein KR093_003540 [Drosophila rubida]|uniref:Uncharacterized protein n=1 Tax=Drosophila rubida TaxID=30044 RepID=A0AAD4PRC5_9MUSC|nr:hypothetical protein KR093_003540 [Drosophila rubida]
MSGRQQQQPQESQQQMGYNPQTTPPIHGVRFFNPFYRSQGNVPKKTFTRKPRPEPVSFSKPPVEMANGLPHFQGYYSPLALHRLANADVYGPQELATAQEQLQANQVIEEQQEAASLEPVQKPQQDEAPVAPKPTAPAAGTSSSNGGNNRPRRQGRNRSRGFTQSFGIVAPAKRSNTDGNANMKAAKDVLSLFDRKPPVTMVAASRKLPPEDVHLEDGQEERNIEWPLPVNNNHRHGNMKRNFDRRNQVH